MKERISAYIKQTIKIPQFIADKEFKLISEESKYRLYTFGRLFYKGTSHPLFYGPAVYYLTEKWHSEELKESKDKVKHLEGNLDTKEKTITDLQLRNDGLVDSVNAARIECAYHKDVSVGFESAYHGSSWLPWRRPPIVHRSKFSLEDQAINIKLANQSRLIEKLKSKFNLTEHSSIIDEIITMNNELKKECREINNSKLLNEVNEIDKILEDYKKRSLPVNQVINRR
jgi:hypothetical protein